MAKSKEAPARSKRPWLRYVLLLFFGGGGGAGGVLFKDHPVLQKLFNTAVHRDPEDGPITGKDALRAVVQAVAEVKDAETYRKAGDFEVVISSLAIAPEQFKHGQTLDLRVKLIKLGSDDRETVVWDSRDKEDEGHPVVVGTREIKTTFSDLSIPVSWQPGEGFALEVWDRKPLKHRLIFSWSSPEDDTAFPLKSGTYDLARAERGKLVDQEGCHFTVESRPRGQAKASPAAAIAREAAEAIRKR